MGVVCNLSMCYEMEMVSFQEESIFCEGFVSLRSRILGLLSLVHIQKLFISAVHHHFGTV